MDRAEPIPPTAVGKAVYLVYAPFIKPVDDGFDHKRSLASRSGDPDPSGSGAGVACTVRIVTDAIRRQTSPRPGRSLRRVAYGAITRRFALTLRP